jgi:hypothetical protein
MRVFQTLLAFSGNAQPQLVVTCEPVGSGHEVRFLPIAQLGSGCWRLVLSARRSSVRRCGRFIEPAEQTCCSVLHVSCASVLGPPQRLRPGTP